MRICNSVGKHPECANCGAAVPHVPLGCEQCPFVADAKCVELSDILTEYGLVPTLMLNLSLAVLLASLMQKHGNDWHRIELEMNRFILPKKLAVRVEGGEKGPSMMLYRLTPTLP